MDARIVRDIINDIIDKKVYKLKARGIIVANYDELLYRLLPSGYTEDEVKAAIIELVRTKTIKTGKFYHGKDDNGNDIWKGWLREFRDIDRQDDLRPE